MKQKQQIKGKGLLMMVVCTICLLCSCEKDNIIFDSIENGSIIAIGTGGDFTVVNIDTNDTLKINGALQIFDGSPIYEILEAHNGNRIKVKFEQNNDYKEYVFETTYMFPNGEVAQNHPEYEFVVEDALEASYDILLGASSKGETKFKSWIITAEGGFTLKVVQ